MSLGANLLSIFVPSYFLTVTKKAQTKAFTMIYKQKVVVLPLFVTFPFSSSQKMT